MSASKVWGTIGTAGFLVSLIGALYCPAHGKNRPVEERVSSVQKSANVKSPESKDATPCGWQVLFGLSFMAITMAKITSDAETDKSIRELRYGRIYSKWDR